MDFVHDSWPTEALPHPAVVDQWSRQSPMLEAGFSLRGHDVAAALDRVFATGITPRSITVDHGTEFTSGALEDWAYARGVALEFTRPGKPTDNSHIESFNGRLRDEFLNVHEFASLVDVRTRLEAWRVDYNEQRPHSSLGHLTPREFTILRQATTGLRSRRALPADCLLSGPTSGALTVYLRLSGWRGSLRLRGEHVERGQPQVGHGGHRPAVPVVAAVYCPTSSSRTVNRSTSSSTVAPRSAAAASTPTASGRAPVAAALTAAYWSRISPCAFADQGMSAQSSTAKSVDRRSQNPERWHDLQDGRRCARRCSQVRVGRRVPGVWLGCRG